MYFVIIDNKYSIDYYRAGTSTGAHLPSLLSPALVFYIQLDTYINASNTYVFDYI